MRNLQLFTRHFFIILFTAILLLPATVYSTEKEYVRTYTYQASEKDSKLAARNSALEQVQHQLLSELGTYVKSIIDSSTKSSGKKYSQHEINTLTAGIVKTEIMDEKWDGRSYYIKVKLLADPDDISKKIQAELKRQNNQKRSTRSSTTIKPVTASTDAKLTGTPRVKMETSKGAIIIELYPEKAPKSVANFLDYVNSGSYDGTIFHRVIKDFMNQGGGFTPDYKKVGTKDPIQNEADNGLKNLKFTLAMARTSAPHSATNQFFINTADNAFLDHTGKSMRGWGYTVFGKVVEGQNIVGAISRVKTGPGGTFSKDAPSIPIIIQKVTEIN